MEPLTKLTDSPQSKAKPIGTWLNWLRYSGASVTVAVNPWHWQWIPQIQNEPLDTWIGPNERRFYVSWLMLTMRIWTDDGAW